MPASIIPTMAMPINVPYSLPEPPNTLVPPMNTAANKEIVSSMVRVADMTRAGLINGDLSTVMSPRTVLSWVENYTIFGDKELAFRFAFLNKCDELEWPTINEYYQRCFGVDLLKKA